MDIIVPCAGKSSRFPGMRPKYLLTDYQGKLMVEQSISSISKYGKVYVVILKEHIDEFDSENILKECFGDCVQLIILDEPTRSPAETIYKTLKMTDIKGTFLIKDCDSFFDIVPIENNVVYTSKLSNNPTLNNVSQLGYVISNDQGIVTGLVEKKIVSDSFCVGGYQFSHPSLFIDAFESLDEKDGELYISTIIDYLVHKGIVFIDSEVKNYINVGTLDAWKDYNNKPTIFCDIDGVLVENLSSYGRNSYVNKKYVVLENNYKRLKQLHSNGCEIIFVTARGNEFKAITKKMLDDLGFDNCQLIMNLHHAKRYLINDYSNTNAYPSCVAINVKRDSDNLKDFL